MGIYREEEKGWGEGKYWEVGERGDEERKLGRRCVEKGEKENSLSPSLALVLFPFLSLFPSPPSLPFLFILLHHSFSLSLSLRLIT